MIKYKKCLFTLLSSLFVGSCSMMTPEPATLKVETPDQWAHLSKENLQQENSIAYIAWWEKLQDNTLNDLINEGLKNNTTIGQAQGNLEQAKGQLKAIELSWIPSISALGGYSNNPNLGGPLGFYGIWPQYALFNIFHTIAITKSAKLEVAIQEQAITAIKLVLIGQIANSYYTYIAELSQLKLYEQYQKDLNEILAIQKENHQGNLSSAIEVETMAQEAHQAVVQQKTIQKNIIYSQNALRYLLNQNPGTITANTQFFTTHTYYNNVSTLPATVLANRPDIAIAELQYHLAVQNKGGTYTELLPAVQLGEFMGASNVGSPQFFGTRTNVHDAYAVWSINPAVFGEIDALKGAEKTAYYKYIDTVKAALKDVDNDLVNHSTANQSYDAIFAAYQNAQQKYALVENLYQAGISSYRQALQEKLNLDKLATEVNQAKLTQMITLVNLYQDLGGGVKGLADK